MKCVFDEAQNAHAPARYLRFGNTRTVEMLDELKTYGLRGFEQAKAGEAPWGWMGALAAGAGVGASGASGRLGRDFRRELSSRGGYAAAPTRMRCEVPNERRRAAV